MSLIAFVASFGDLSRATALDDANQFLAQLTESPVKAAIFGKLNVRYSSVFSDELEDAECTICDRSEHWWVLFDGWIQNRESLSEELRSSGIDVASKDCEIVLAAYREWGSNAGARLFGEYSAILSRYESGTGVQEVHAIRDCVGVRPLFLSYSDSVVEVSNFAGALRAACGRAMEIDWPIVGAFATRQTADPSRTVYVNVSRIANGGLATFGSKRLKPRVRQLEPLSPIVCRSKPTGASFGAVLRESVRTAARSRHTLGVQISGGVDSSVIACVLADEIDRGGAPCPSVLGLNRTYTEPQSDESAYVDDLAASLNFPITRIPVSYPPLETLSRFVRMTCSPHASFAGTAVIPIAEHLRALGGRICLTGELGDALFFPTSFAFVHAALSPSQWPALLKFQARRWGESQRFGRARSRVYAAFNHLLPEKLRFMLERTIRRRNGGYNRFVPERWLAEIDAVRAPMRRGLRSRTVASQIVRSGQGFTVFEYQHSLSFLTRVEFRHPLASAKCVFTAAQFPLASLDGQDGINRVPLRQAGGSRLPKRIGTRIDKGEFTVSVLPALRAICSQYFGIAASVREDAARGGEHEFLIELIDPRYVWELDRVLAIGLWRAAITRGLTE